MTDIHPRLKKGLALLLLLSFTCFTYSCKHKQKRKKNIVETGFSYDEFSETLEKLMPSADTSAPKKIGTTAADMRYAYLQNDYLPIWLSHGYKPDATAEQFITELADIKWDGINPEVYGFTAINKLKDKLGRKETTLADAIAFDTTLTRAYLMAAKDLLIGRIVPKTVDSLWYHANDSTWNAPQLLTDMQVKYTSLNEFRSTVPTYKLLNEEYKRLSALNRDSNFVIANNYVKELSAINDSEAKAQVTSVIMAEAPWITTEANDTISEWKQMILAYQDFIGVKPTGKPDSLTMAYLGMNPDTLLPKLAANMERIRWMQKDFGDMYILVNVPLAQLFFRINDTNAMHMRVVVGKPVRQTPSLFAKMSNVVLNPQWGVPSTILKQDVLPGIQKSGNDYMKKKGLKAYDRAGNVVNVKNINAKNYKRYSYRQPPGDDNALGYVKFNLPNPWDIYLHDTPHRDDFVKRDRALSSGCIRLQHPQEMAVFILSQIEKKKFTLEQLDSIIGTHKTQWRVLSNKIPVHIAYLTAFEDTTGKHINFVRDVYHRDGKLIAKLAGN